MGSVDELPGQDALTGMLARQLETQVAFNADPRTMEGDELADYVVMMSTALVDEIHEALNEVAWKSWSKDRGRVNREEFLRELVDAWHFFMNLWLTVGGTAEEFVAGYYAKNEINHQRAASDYDGWDKCGVCGRALEDTKCSAEACGYVDPAAVWDRYTEDELWVVANDSNNDAVSREQALNEFMRRGNDGSVKLDVAAYPDSSVLGIHLTVHPILKQLSGEPMLLSEPLDAVLTKVNGTWYPAGGDWNLSDENLQLLVDKDQPVTLHATGGGL